MHRLKVLMRGFVPAVGLLLWVGVGALRAQDEESPEQKQYREDYEKTQKLVAIPDLNKRAESLLQFMKERPNSKLNDYAQANYLQALELLSKSEKYPAVIALSEKLIALRPRVGETYYFYGAALKNAGKMTEAMNALAKSYVLKNSASRKAKEFLDFLYKQKNGSLIGEEKLIKAAEAEIGK
jgi:hypothetical protein